MRRPGILFDARQVDQFNSEWGGMIMTDIKRIWKRDSRYIKQYSGQSRIIPAYILETVDIDLVEHKCLTPTVTLHPQDQTVSIHDQCNWGSIRMTEVQALYLAEKITNAITQGK